MFTLVYTTKVLGDRIEDEDQLESLDFEPGTECKSACELIVGSLTWAFLRSRSLAVDIQGRDNLHYCAMEMISRHGAFSLSRRRSLSSTASERERRRPKRAVDYRIRDFPSGQQHKATTFSKQLTLLNHNTQRLYQRRHGR